MSWQRFEERKHKGYRGYLVTLARRDEPRRRGKYVVHLSLNNAFMQEVGMRKLWIDFYINAQAQMVAFKLLEVASDENSYHLWRQGDRKQARCSVTRLAQKLAITEALRKGNFTAAVKGDRASGMWWFSIAPLLGGTVEPEQEAELTGEKDKVSRLILRDLGGPRHWYGRRGPYRQSAARRGQRRSRAHEL